MNIGAFRDAIDYAVDVVMPYLDEFDDTVPDVVRGMVNLRLNAFIAEIEEIDVRVNDWHDDTKEMVTRFVDNVIADIEHKRDNTSFVSDTVGYPYNSVVMDIYENFPDEVNEAFKSCFSFDEFNTIDDIIITGVHLYRERICVEEMNEVIDEFNAFLTDTIMDEISDRYKNGEL